MKIQYALEFQVLYNKLKNAQLPIRLAYKFNKLNDFISTEAHFYQESLQKILDQYAERDESDNFVTNSDGTGILIKPDFVDICHKKINELQSIDFEIKDIKFTLEELESLQITPSELYCLTSLIEE